MPDPQTAPVAFVAALAAGRPILSALVDARLLDKEEVDACFIAVRDRARTDGRDVVTALVAAGAMTEDEAKKWTPGQPDYLRLR